MSSARRTGRRQRRRAPRLVGPAVLDLVATLAHRPDETVELRLSAALAALIDTVEGASAYAPRPQQPSGARAASVTVDRATAERWEAQAWRAVGEGRVAAAEAQHLSDQLAPRGAP